MTGLFFDSSMRKVAGVRVTFLQKPLLDQRNINVIAVAFSPLNWTKHPIR
jgi:hypothetical protein